MTDIHKTFGVICGKRVSGNVSFRLDALWSGTEFLAEQASTYVY